jgi:serine/threonine-protein kinase RsbW
MPATVPNSTGIRASRLKAQALVWHNQAILTETEVLLHGRLGELQCLVSEIARFCREHSLGSEVEFELNLVLEELFTNSIRHGGCAGMENAVHVRLQLHENGVHVEYADRGMAFDPLSAPPPDLEMRLEDRNVGGFGIHFVRQIMRDLEYRRQGGWNQITMRRPC